MLIDHPLLGPRDAREFVYLGDATLLDRPDPDAYDARGDAIDAFVEWLYLRDNPAGLHDELWYHEQGDRSWLVVTRDTTTHEIHAVRLARDVALERRREGRGQALEPRHEGVDRGQAVERRSESAGLERAPAGSDEGGERERTLARGRDGDVSSAARERGR